MLRLASDTPVGWVQEAERHLDLLLVDHAHCEKKAASTALNLMFRYPNATFLYRPLAALAEEELQHFRLVMDVLASRDIPFRAQVPSPYAGQLMKGTRREEPGRMVDTLLCCALIEARSCERMKALSEGLGDPSLRSLYGDLLASEARHHGLYVDLARQASEGDDAQIRERLAALAAHEAAILAEHDPELRMHSGFAA